MKKVKLPKILVLDYRKWICGDGPDNPTFKLKNPAKRCGIGKGDTKLHNDYGYQCCLGQFSSQAGVPNDEMKNIGCPDGICNYNVCGLVVLRDNNFGGKRTQDNRFSSHAMAINDDSFTTIPQKVKKLQSLCKKYNRELKLKNFPESILKELG